MTGPDALRLTVRALFTNDVFCLTALRGEPLYSVRWRLAAETGVLVKDQVLSMSTAGERARLSDDANARSLAELGLGDGAELWLGRHEVALDVYRSTDDTYAPPPPFRQFETPPHLCRVYGQRDRTIGSLKEDISRDLSIPPSLQLLRLTWLPVRSMQDDDTTLGELALPPRPRISTADDCPTPALFVARRSTPAPVSGGEDAEVVELQLRFAPEEAKSYRFPFSRQETVDQLRWFCCQLFEVVRSRRPGEYRLSNMLSLRCKGVTWRSEKTIGDYQPRHNAVVVIDLIARPHTS